MRRSTSLKVAIACAIGAGLCLIVLLSGCGTARQHAYVGQALDMATTYYGLECVDGVREGNPMITDVWSALAVKAAVMCAVEWAAHIYPARADTIYAIGAWCGYGASAHNGMVLAR